MQDKDKQVFRHIRCGLCVFQHQDRLMIYIEPISGNKHHVLRFCQIQILESAWHAYNKLHLFDNQKLSNRCFFIPGKFNISLYSQLYSISCLQDLIVIDFLAKFCRLFSEPKISLCSDRFSCYILYESGCW